MPFDGVEWDAPLDGSVLAAYPGSPCTAEALACGLVSGYYSARHNGRLFSVTNYQTNARSGDDADLNFIVGLLPETIAGSWGWVDGTFTHAVAVILAEVAATIDVEANARVTAFDGTTTNTGTTVATAIVANARASTAAPFGAISLDVPYEDTLIMQTAEVSLTGLTLSQRVRILAQGHVASIAVQGYYRPRRVEIWLECRG